MPAIRVPALLRLALIVCCTLVLCARHALDGWHLAFATHDELAEQFPWMSNLPTSLVNLVGIFELGLAAMLLLALARPHFNRIGIWACYGILLLHSLLIVMSLVTQDPISNWSATAILLSGILLKLFEQRMGVPR